MNAHILELMNSLRCLQCQSLGLVLPILHLACMSYSFNANFRNINGFIHTLYPIVFQILENPLAEKKKKHTPTVMAHVNCQFDRIKNQLGAWPLRVPVGNYLDYVN